jgi:tetratricopeptide (TPR) repeat protein
MGTDNRIDLPVSPPRWPVVLAGAMIVLAALAAYHNSFSGPFVFDDSGSTTENPTIRHLWPVWKVLSPPSDQTVGGRPLPNLSLALNYALSGYAVWSYHALNLLIHILAGLVLFGVVRRTLLRFDLSACGRGALDSRQAARRSQISNLRSEMLEPTWLALTVALLWVVHPLQTESVTYIIQRAESLMGLFYLLTLYCFIRGVEGGKSRVQSPESRNQRIDSPHSAPASLSRHSVSDGGSPQLWFLLSVTACLLGMASKEVMVSAPLMVLLYDRTFVAGSFRAAWQQRRKFYLGLASTWMLLGYLVAATGNRGNSAGFGVNVAWWSYAFTQFRAIVHYLQLSLWPNRLVFYYGTGLATRPAEIVPYAVIVLLLAIGTAIAFWRRPAIGFAGCWFFAILAPSSSVVPIATETMAEHRMYLALASVVALVVLGLYRLLGRRSAVIFLALAAGLGCATVQRNTIYLSALTLWNDTVAKCPDNARAHNNLGLAMADIPGRMQEAIAEFEVAVRLDPNDVEAHDNLGNALIQIPGRLPEAIAQYEAALRIDPGHAKVHNNLGNALMQVPDRLPEAIAQYEAALRTSPDFSVAHYNLGVALMKIPRRLPEAVAELEAALQTRPDKPDYEDAHYELGLALSEIPGRSPEAIAEYELALRINPNNADAHYNLGNALMKIPGRSPEAVAEYETALQINPNNAEAHNTLGCALGGDPGRLPDAILHFQAAVRIKPDYVDAHYNLANALMDIPGRSSEAIAEYEAVLRINPDDAEAHNNLGCALGDTSKRLPDAIANFQEAVRIKPDYAEAHKNLGMILSDIPGRRLEAMAEFETALRIDPNLDSVRQKLAELHAARQ